MQIAEQSDERLVITHGSAVLLAVFALLSAVLTWGLVFVVSRLGWANEPASYTAVFLAICLYGLFNSRLTTFTFDTRARELRWRRRGVVPASGSEPFDRIEQAVLDVRADRKGTPYYRVLLAVGGGRALPFTPGRTRDVFRCLEVLEAVAGVLGQPRMAELVRAGRTDEALRLAENRYGVPRRAAEVYLERHAARAATD